MAEIKLSRGYVALVDDDALVLVSKHRWSAVRYPNNRNVYASSFMKMNGRRATLSMHRYVLGLTIGNAQAVDHINGNTLDNRRSNLRLCSASQNGANSRIRKNTSGFKGVSFNSGRWVARIRVRRRLIHLGRFIHPQEAALAYDHAARQHFGEFALCNYPDES